MTLEQGVIPEENRPGSGPWWQEAVFYQILVDRFCRFGADEPLRNPSLPVFCGGNLRGVMDRLDYLRRLGITALWLSPIQRTASYHGYHITDFQRVEKRFGGMASFRALLRAAKPDLRIVLDWVPNHLHSTHPFFQEALQSKRSRYREWFYFDRHGDHLSFLDVPELPKLNLDHPEARRYMIDCAKNWLDLGVDGFRLDHVLGPSMDFWHAFKAGIKQHKPAAYLVGEALFLGIQRRDLKTLRMPGKLQCYEASIRGHSVADQVQLEYAGVFDGLLDFGFQEILKAQVARARHRPSSAQVQARLDGHYRQFPASLSLPSFLDNHDLNRFLFEAKGDRTRLMQAAEIQFQQVQTPIIYYGTEAGMTQDRAVDGQNGDLPARQWMAWTHQDPELLGFYTGLIRARKRRGSPLAEGGAQVLPDGKSENRR